MPDDSLREAAASGKLNHDPKELRRQVERMLEDPKARAFIRSILSQAAEIKLDRQGRATIPRKLLAKADIDDQMVVIGALDKLEFWNPDDWRKFLDEADPNMEAVAESLDLQL